MVTCAHPRATVRSAVLLAGAAAVAAALIPPLWAAGGLAVVGLAMLLFRCTRLYVYLYLIVALLPYAFLRYLNEFRLFGDYGGVNLVGAGWVASIALFTVYSVWRKERWWRIREYRPALILIVLALATIFVSGNWQYGLRNWVHLAAPVGLSLLLYSQLKERGQTIRAARHIFAVFAVVLAIGFYQLGAGTGSFDFAAQSYRLSGLYGEGGEVSYAVLLLYLSCLALGLVLGHAAELRSSNAAVLVVSIVLLVLSQSRAPLVAFLIAAVVMLTQAGMKLRCWTLLLPVLAAAQFSPRVYSRFGSPLLSAASKFWESPDVSVNLLQRMATWMMLVDEFVDRRGLILGRGFGFADNYLLYELQDPAGVFSRSVHNEYLRLLVDLGLAGVILLVLQLSVLYGVGRRLWLNASDPLVRGMGIGLCGMVPAYVVVALTSNMYGAGAQNVVFWIVVALMLSVAHWNVPDAAEREPSARACC